MKSDQPVREGKMNSAESAIAGLANASTCCNRQSDAIPVSPYLGFCKVFGASPAPFFALCSAIALLMQGNRTRLTLLPFRYSRS
jgi:hypothetical protein